MTDSQSGMHQETIMELVREEFRHRFSSNATSVLLDRVSIASYRDGTVTLNVDGEFIYNILRERYHAVLEKTFSEILGFEIHVELVNVAPPVDPQKFIRQIQTDAYGHSEQEKYEEEQARIAAESAVEKDDLVVLSDAQRIAAEAADRNYLLNGTEGSEPKLLTKTEQSIPPAARLAPDGHVELPAYNFDYTFENFIVGSSNKLAYAACQAVVAKPAREYNPLFIYGPSGIGKTHLLWATMNGLAAKRPGTRMVYIKSEDFINEMVERMAKQEMKKFRDKFRSCDVLLIDDIQFIAGKVAMQEEFFHTFNALYENKKQIIMTSDKPPHEIQHLEDRLVSRFEWGLIADIQQPDLELRMAIIKTKAEQVGIQMDDEILVYLAENLRSNIRQLEGAIKKLGACYFLGQPISMELARGCISELLGGAEPQNITIGKIFAAVHRQYGVTKEDLLGKKRSKEIAFARHLTMYLMRDVTEMSFPNIAKQFNRDHTTVISSVDLIARKRRVDKAFEAEYMTVRKEVTGS